MGGGQWVGRDMKGLLGADNSLVLDVGNGYEDMFYDNP